MAAFSYGMGTGGGAPQGLEERKRMLIQALQAQQRSGGALGARGGRQMGAGTRVGGTPLSNLARLAYSPLARALSNRPIENFNPLIGQGIGEALTINTMQNAPYQSSAGFQYGGPQQMQQMEAPVQGIGPAAGAGSGALGAPAPSYAPPLQEGGGFWNLFEGSRPAPLMVGRPNQSPIDPVYRIPRGVMRPV